MGTDGILPGRRYRYFYIVLPLSGVLNIIYTIINIVEIANGSINLEPVNETEKFWKKPMPERRRKLWQFNLCLLF